MSTAESMREKVIEHLIEASDVDIEASDVKEESSLRADLDLSSLQAVTLVMDLEDEFGVSIEDEEIEKLETVGDVLDLLSVKLEQGD